MISISLVAPIDDGSVEVRYAIAKQIIAIVKNVIANLPLDSDKSNCLPPTNPPILSPTHQPRFHEKKKLLEIPTTP
jgi:hypothetical protein